MDKINGLFLGGAFSIDFEVLFLLYHGKTEQALLGSILLGIAIDVDKKVAILKKKHSILS